MKKITALVTMMLGLAVQTQAALQISFTGGGGDPDPPSASLTFNVATDTFTITPSDMFAVSATGSFEGTSSGTFDLVFPTPIGSGGVAFDPATWSGSGGSDSFIVSGSTGWGVASAIDTTENIDNGEALFFKFDLSGLSLTGSESLFLTEVAYRDRNAHLELWKRTGTNSGTVVFSEGEWGSSNEEVVAPVNLKISDGDEFALTAVGAGQKRLRKLTFKVDAPPTAAATPTNLTAVGLDSAVVLDWDDDATGLLDYYTVYRSTTSPVTTNDALTTVTASRYLDPGAANGTTYFYAVSATGTIGPESGLSAEVSAIPVANTNVVLYQHLDANDANSVYISSGQVLSWYDQTAYSTNPLYHDASWLDGIVVYPSTSLSASGLAGMDMGTSQNTLRLFTDTASDSWLDFTGAAQANSGFAVLVAFKVDAVETGDDNPVIANTSGSGQPGSFGLRFTTEGTMQAYLDGETYNKILRSPVEVGDTIVFSLSYEAITGLVEFWDSKNQSSLIATNVPLGDFTQDRDIKLGGNQSSSEIFNGMVGEVKIYSSKLSPAMLQSERAALTNKWGRPWLAIPRGRTGSAWGRRIGMMMATRF